MGVVPLTKMLNTIKPLPFYVGEIIGETKYLESGSDSVMVGNGNVLSSYKKVKKKGKVGE